MSNKKMISFPSIDQFVNVIGKINRTYNFVGLDENGDGIYDHSKPKPVLKFIGTIKLHGTNYSVCYNEEDGMWCQSKENIITPLKDNAGSAAFANARQNEFIELFNQVYEKNGLDKKENTISIYMEWAGKGIQKKVSISNLEKSAFIIGVKITPFNEDKPAYWVDFDYIRNSEKRIYNILDYKTYEIEIDFNNPKLVQNTLLKFVEEIEAECPVAKAFGFSGIGEGVVFSHRYADGSMINFKCKGDEHSNSKVETLKPVDDVRENKIVEVVNKVCTGWRLEQMLEKTFDFMNGGKIEIKRLGDFIKNVIADIIKEETSTIIDADLIPKDINSKVAETCRKYFFDQQNKDAGLN